MHKGIDVFTPPDQIEYYANKIHQEIASDNYLHSLEAESVPIKLARYIGLLNKLHPFPDGNGRTQRVFISHLTKEAGYRVDWSRTTPIENQYCHQAAYRQNNYYGLEQMMRRVIEKT